MEPTINDIFSDRFYLDRADGWSYYRPIHNTKHEKYRAEQSKLAKLVRQSRLDYYAKLAEEHKEIKVYQ